jgi:hypothetical protein
MYKHCLKHALRLYSSTFVTTTVTSSCLQVSVRMYHSNGTGWIFKILSQAYYGREGIPYFYGTINWSTVFTKDRHVILI